MGGEEVERIEGVERGVRGLLRAVETCGKVGDRKLRRRSLGIPSECPWEANGFVNDHVLHVCRELPLFSDVRPIRIGVGIAKIVQSVQLIEEF